MYFGVKGYGFGWIADEACDREREEVRRVLSNVSNIHIKGCDLKSPSTMTVLPTTPNGTAKRDISPIRIYQQTTIKIKLPLNKEDYRQTMLMARHLRIAKLFDEDFWATQ